MSTVPDDRMYTKDDDWLKHEGDAYRMGITDYAQGKLGEIVNVDFMKKEGAHFRKGEAIAVIESVKATVDIHAPFDGTVVKTNGGLLTASMEYQGHFNDKPYEEWMFVVKATGPAELMKPEDYRALVATKK